MKPYLTWQSGANPEIEIWRIYEPDVTRPQSPPVTDFSLNPGDAISFDAGGCVRTGGGGKTWKRYVDPSGGKSDRLYHGTVFLPGWNNLDGSSIPIRIRTFVPYQTQYVVPPYGSGFLSIGYEDDDYSGNGYTDHDDGTQNQCKDSVNAWIDVRITHPYVYENHFHTRSRHRGTPGHPRSIDYLVPETSGLPIMKAGSNGNSIEPPAVIDPGGGVTLEVEANVSPGKLASRTVYLLSNDLSRSGFLRAELEFDSPQAPNGGDSNGWGVALNFKNGDESDQATDVKSGATCQFMHGGDTVNFHFTNALNPTVDLTSAGVKPGYLSLAKATFKLVVQICRDSYDAVASYAELWINGNLVNHGTLTVSLPPLSDTIADPTKLTAVGFALVSKDGEDVKVRFRSFTLKYQLGPIGFSNEIPDSA